MRIPTCARRCPCPGQASLGRTYPPPLPKRSPCLSPLPCVEHCLCTQNHQSIHRVRYTCASGGSRLMEPQDERSEALEPQPPSRSSTRRRWSEHRDHPSTGESPAQPCRAISRQTRELDSSPLAEHPSDRADPPREQSARSMSCTDSPAPARQDADDWSALRRRFLLPLAPRRGMGARVSQDTR